MAGQSLIDDYVDALAARLRGPAALRRDLLTEARDSLHDAAESYLDAGFDPEEAQRRAVEDFGPVGRIAREYQAELAVAHGVRFVRSLLLLIPLVHGLWELNRLLWVGEGQPDWYRTVAQATDLTSWVLAGSAAVILIAFRWLARLIGDTRLVGRLTGAWSVGAVGVYGFSLLTVVVATAGVDPGLVLLSPPVLLATLVTFAVVARLVVLARRCFVLVA
ncbi:hypothetical protein LX15_005601 [Streptoalloteichus tenebrarius]|uniref:DUF1700 domain-containing protein n=1 Tax=Streptoalloteichus tenebrarius (strain ATCC 17920 / DSM 40477 / JCM 4838 / CBS 697.72 / NBRC 16177 / NCIMB 11028 / NRRL B-12390 / A12253. 1 / ISP 5477) TaxID=1933 RepID=A0ABT1I271_STRSD|nr:permease prefix domain 1-containing protein [Streptoalloteichus tenebrarius]MCP2261874.1 hypothetical protein [Streptoalloteichus tenebrarius]BFF01065.1 permease prefix domain 1-containing protein [Streptoalloteichus tenebrarius]